MKRRRVKIGDVFEISLSDGQIAFGRYVFKDKKWGPLVQIYDLIVQEQQEQIRVEQLKKAKNLFPPVITGVFAATRTGLWNIIGSIPVNDFEYPNFVSAYYNEKTGQAHAWFLWNGEEFIELGAKLPDEYKNLEYLQVWDPHNLMDRIKSGGRIIYWPKRDLN